MGQCEDKKVLFLVLVSKGRNFNHHYNHRQQHHRHCRHHLVLVSLISYPRYFIMQELYAWLELRLIVEAVAFNNEDFNQTDDDVNANDYYEFTYTVCLV